jgi:hypothetical protein
MPPKKGTGGKAPRKLYPGEVQQKKDAPKHSEVEQLKHTMFMEPIKKKK